MNIMVKKTREKFIEESVAKFKKDKFDYTYVIYKNAHEPVKLICDEHGLFEQTPHSHLRSDTGCTKCGREAARNARIKPFDVFVKEAKEIHGNKYYYYETKYRKDGSDYTEIYCNTCDEYFLQTPDSHLSGSGCMKCSINHKADLFRKDVDQFIIDAKQVHGDKYYYIFDTIKYKNNKTKIEIFCKIHNKPFFQRPDQHLNGTGCPLCSPVGYSKKAIDWLEYIMKRDNIHIQHAENDGEYQIGRYHADGYCKENNTVYEFNGCVYHSCNSIECPLEIDPRDINPINKKKNCDVYDKTIKKENDIKDKGYNLVVIWEHEWDRFVKDNKKKTKELNL
jgi:hypothetical protein